MRPARDALSGWLWALLHGHSDGPTRASLERVARALDGPLRRGWLGSDRVDGHLDGRAVELRWLGNGVAEVRCRAPSSARLELRRPGWLRRLLGQREPRVLAGEAPLATAARELLLRHHGRFLRIEGGRLTFRAAPGEDAAALIQLARDAVDLVWTEARPAVKVQQAREGEAHTGRCPFCHDDLREEAPVVYCDACAAPHHPSCFEEGGGCSIAGCREQRARGKREKA
ncbi:MAG: RING finger protein [Planctomycetota bacterium]